VLPKKKKKKKNQFTNPFQEAYSGDPKCPTKAGEQAQLLGIYQLRYFCQLTKDLMVYAAGNL
jgi:hypothetical protein